MKKLFLLAVMILVLCPCVFSQEKNSPAINPLSAQKPIQVKKATLQAITKPFVKPTVPLLSDETLSSIQQANLFYCSNEIEKSFEILLTIPESQRTPQEWVLLGNILQDKGRISDSIFMYQRAILIDSKCYKAYYNLANIYLEDDKPFLAIENYRKANKSKNDFPYAYYNLGCAYIQSGNLKSAKIAFLKAIELNKNDPDFYYNLAYTYKKLNKPQLSKQYLEFYNKALEIQGS